MARRSPEGEIKQVIIVRADLDMGKGKTAAQCCHGSLLSYLEAAKVGKEIVDTVGTTVAPYSNDISVRGYADNVPVTGGPWYSNFMLSSARATSVVLRLARADGVAENRLVVEGFGSTHPVASNSTPAGRAQNRRVDIVILAERN